MLEADLVQWLGSVLPGTDVFYQHIDRKTPDEFAWVIRSGDDSEDELDGGGEPDRVFFDLEIYARDLTTMQALSQAIRDERDYRGTFGDGYVDDVEITDQIDDYQTRANADSLPEFSTTFRMVVTGYAPP